MRASTAVLNIAVSLFVAPAPALLMIYVLNGTGRIDPLQGLLAMGLSAAAYWIWLIARFNRDHDRATASTHDRARDYVPEPAERVRDVSGAGAYDQYDMATMDLPSRGNTAKKFVPSRAMFGVPEHAGDVPDRPLPARLAEPERLLGGQGGHVPVRSRPLELHRPVTPPSARAEVLQPQPHAQPRQEPSVAADAGQLPVPAAPTGRQAAAARRRQGGGGSRDLASQAADLREVKSLVERHSAALLGHWRRTVRQDEYGGQDLSRWQMEAERFLNSVGFRGRAIDLDEAVMMVTGTVQDLAEAAGISVPSPDQLGSPAAPSPMRLGAGMQVIEARAENVRPVSGSGEDDVAFQRWCSRTLRRHGWTTHGTEEAKGLGIDLLAERDDMIIGLHCKLYSGEVDETPVSAVDRAVRREFLDAAGVVATRGFTAGAQALARTKGVALINHTQLGKIEQIVKSASTGGGSKSLHAVSANAS